MREKITFDFKDIKSIISRKKRATIRIGIRRYSNRIKIYAGRRYLGEARVINQFPFKIKNLEDWMVRKIGMNRKSLLRELFEIYGNLKNKVFTFVEFELRVYFCGIDLGLKYSGVYIVDGNKKKVFSGRVKNDEIINIVKKFKPLVVAIDAPLKEIPTSWRDSELELIKRGFKPLPLNMKSMKELTKIAIDLKKKIKRKVIETFADADKKILKIKGKSDITDARACALTAYLYLLNEVENLKGIIIPKEK